MGQVFSDYVTSVSFHMSLSREQCSMLHWICTSNGAAILEYRRFCPALKALIAKGLIEKISEEQRAKNNRSKGWMNKPNWKATEEGKLVHKLLICANIVPWANQNLAAAK